MAADGEFFVLGGDDFPGRVRAHHLADANRRHVGFALVHPAAHRGVERDIGVAHDEFAVARHRHGFLDEIEIAALGQAHRTRGEAELSVDGGHAYLRASNTVAYPVARTSAGARVTL